MKGKASEIPVKNFRIADDEKAGDVKELPARPAVHGRFSNNEVVDAQATAIATVAARTPDTPLSEVYSDPNAAQETAATAAAAAGVEVPQVNGVANGAAAADGPSIDHHREQPVEEQELEGDAADIAHTSDRFEPAVNKVAADSGLEIVTFLKRDRFFGDAWRKLDEKQQESKIDEIYDLAKRLCYGSVNAVASRGFDFVEMTLSSVKITLKEDGRKCEVAGTVHYDSAFVIDSVDNKSIMLVPRNTNQFLGGKKVKPDVIGTLRLPDPELPLGQPTSGPGTPTPIVVMDAVGKGPEAAVVAAAAVAAEPAPAPTTVA